MDLHRKRIFQRCNVLHLTDSLFLSVFMSSLFAGLTTAIQSSPLFLVWLVWLQSFLYDSSPTSSQEYIKQVQEQTSMKRKT